MLAKRIAGRSSPSGLRDHPGHYQQKLLLLDSIGGSVPEALRMGRLLRETGFVALVASNAVCQGSCVYLLAAGQSRTIRGAVGLHRPAYPGADSSLGAEQARQAQRMGEEAKAAMEEAQRAQAAAESAKRDGMFAAAQQLEGIVEIVSSASTQLSAQVEESERGTAITAERLGETATAMEEMNATVLEVARSAGSAASVSTDAKLKAEQGSKVVENVISCIGTVEQQAGQLKADMAQLGQQAESIGAIMNVISDIADQTNLLALNAAIEAARAGEAGRGFAVVADEVRKLAEKTMQATVEVGNAIRGVQNSADKNVRNVDASVVSIAEATRLAREAGAGSARREALRRLSSRSRASICITPVMSFFIKLTCTRILLQRGR